MTVTFSELLENGKVAHYPVSFKYDPNLAMKSLLVADIDQAVPVDQGTVYYDTITASPTSTIVKGHYKMDNGEKSKILCCNQTVCEWDRNEFQVYAGYEFQQKGSPGIYN
ncbi:hypothetical protein ACFTAO_09225 [Paenibacillus rhizoplanae]